MGYRCPVCESLRPDGEHLANHLAITAMLDREDHAAWLADHAPNYGDMGPAELAETIAPHVEAVERDEAARTEQAEHIPGAGERREPTAPPFEYALERQAGRGRTSPQGPGEGLDADTRAVLQEARDLTAEMLGDGDHAAAEPSEGDSLPEDVCGDTEESEDGDRNAGAESGESS